MIRTFNLADKVIVITGGYGHLGKAVTESLLYHGAIVFVFARDEPKFKEEFKDYHRHSKLFFCYCDISDTESIKGAFEIVNQKANRIDVLINNAVYSSGQSPEFMSDDEWSFTIDGVLGSTFKCIREVIPYFKHLGCGKIINVSSMYGMVAPQFEVYDDFPEFLNPPHYGAAKAGVIQLSKYYASYLGHLNINVNTISPGPFPSSSVQLSKRFIDKLKDRTLLNRIGTPEDLAGAFVFLSSSASDFITGQNFVIDGGWTAK